MTTPERLWVDLCANGYGPESVPDDVKPHGVVCIVDTPENLAKSATVQALIAEAVRWGFLSAAPGEWRVSDIQRVTEAIEAAAICAPVTP